MATQADVKRISLSLPDVEQPPGRYAFGVRNKDKIKTFVWVWMERVNPKKPRVPNFDVVAIRVADLATRARLIEENPAAYFTEPHYDGFPAVLVRLRDVKVTALRALLIEGCRCVTPTRATRGSSSRR